MLTIPAKVLFNLSVKHAKTIIEDLQKELLTVLFIHFDGWFMCLPFKAADWPTEDALKITVVAAIKAGITLGEIRGVALCSEAWLSHNSEIKLPSNDPLRKEVVMISTWGQEGQRISNFEIIEKNGHRKVGEPLVPMTSDKMSTWLDEAFKPYEGKVPDPVLGIYEFLKRTTQKLGPARTAILFEENITNIVRRLQNVKNS
jgi:hypothetical protein